MANATGLEIHVSHLPPGTSKWNKIEHKMFCFISKNWQGMPLISIEAVINLIRNTTTKKGLKIVCVKDDNKYELGIKPEFPLEFNLRHKNETRSLIITKETD